MDSLELSKYILAGLLILAGIMHFVKPGIYMKIMPDYLPAHRFLVLLSGAAEIISGILLLLPVTQTIGAYATVGVMIAVFPANVEMSRKYYTRNKKMFWFTILRLPLQLVLIWWALQFVK